MLMVLSKKYSENYEDVEYRLKSLLHKIANEKGIPQTFIVDSKTIMGAVDDISRRIAHLVEDVKIDKDTIKAYNELMRFEREVKIMAPDRDGTGPRKRSPRPSKRKGGQRKGGCK